MDLYAIPLPTLRTVIPKYIWDALPMARQKKRKQGHEHSSEIYGKRHRNWLILQRYLQKIKWRVIR